MGDMLALGAPGAVGCLQARAPKVHVIQHERPAIFAGGDVMAMLQRLQYGVEMFGIQTDGKFADLQAQSVARLADVQIPQADTPGQQGGFHLSRNACRPALTGKKVRQAVQYGPLHALFRLMQKAVGRQAEQRRQDKQGKKEFFHGGEERGGPGRPSVCQSMR